MLNSKQKRGPVAWMAGHSVAANLAMLLCIVGGLIMMRNIKQEVFPETTLDVVQITVPYPGASPEEVERGIVQAIEDAVRDLDGVKEVTSTSSEGFGSVTVELLLGSDLQKLGNDVKNEVDRITTFPAEAEEPQVTLLSRKRQVMSLILHGNVNEVSLRELAEQVRDDLLTNPNITQVELSGVRNLEISIEVSQENLRRYNLTLNEIAQRVRASALELPDGGIKTEGGEVLVRMKERRDFGRQFALLPIISTEHGTEVLLEDMATIKDGLEDIDRYALYDGQPAVMISIYRVGSQTPIQVSDAAKQNLEVINQTLLPPGVKLDVLHDMSDIYRQRVNLLINNGMLGLVLVLVILGLFLEIRLAFWVMLGIPISFLGSFLLLPLIGVSINMISLFAYIIALGIVVDDAIVVGENVYHHHQNGKPFMEAAIVGVREVVMPVTFSILTNIVTFMPLLFIPGMMGKIFKTIPIVVTVVFLISLFESLFVLPAHLGHSRDRQRHGLNAWLHHRQQAFSKGFIRWVNTRYGPFLKLTLRHRYITISAALCILIVCLAYAASGRMGFALFPRVESDFAIVNVVLPYGAAVEKTEAVARQLYEGAQRVLTEYGHPELVKGIFTDIGSGGSHTVQMQVFLEEPKIRDKIMSTNEFVNRWRTAVGEIVGIEYARFQSDFGGPGSGAALTVELSHRDIDVLEKVSSELADVLRTYPTVKDVDDGFQPGKQQIDFTVPAEAKSLGLTASEIARQLRSSFYGSEALRQQRGRNEVKIMVRLPKDERVSEYHLDRLILRTPQGREVPLREVSISQRGRAYTTINRRNCQRVVTVSADVTPQERAGEVLNDLKINTLPQLVSRYPGLSYSFEGKQADMRESMNSLKMGFAMSMLVVFGMLAIPFRSYTQPLIVMVSIPFGIVGAIIGHIIMGYSLSIVSMLGIVALAGVVVNDSLVLIDFTNQRRKQGLLPGEAVYDSAIQRFRPILLTTLTTFGGLAPMIFERSLQARFLIPMAISLGYGILFATFITLVLVPSLYLALEDIHNLFSRKRS